MTKLVFSCLVVNLLLLAGAVPVGAQIARPNRPAAQGRGAGVPEAGVTPAEIQRMFDAYALVQAQDQLQLSDEQYSQFLIRYKALQDIRRQALQDHGRIVAELRRLLSNRDADENTLVERIRALADIESRRHAEVMEAYSEIDQVLDVRQRASFRVFEELMERRKVELITRARQGNRLRQQ
jgi:hypothetical protein